MRVSRILKARLRAKEDEGRVVEISRSLSASWAHMSEMKHIMKSGFVQAEDILQAHLRRIEVLEHRAGDLGA